MRNPTLLFIAILGLLAAQPSYDRSEYTTIPTKHILLSVAYQI